MTLPPIRRSVSVSWDPAAAFRRFTADFGTWWPGRTHSVGGPRVRRIVFEPHAGGCIYEEHVDGRRFQWGEVRLWEPPRKVEFTWHPSREPATAQDVLVEFVPESSGSRSSASCSASAAASTARSPAHAASCRAPERPSIASEESAE